MNSEKDAHNVKEKEKPFEEVAGSVHSVSTNKKKKNKKKNKNEATLNKSLPIFSVRQQLITALNVSGTCGAEDHEIQSFIENCFEAGKMLMDTGELHGGADAFAKAVLISEHSEQMLDRIEKILPPDHFDLVRKKITRYEQECKANCNKAVSDFSKPIKYQKAIPDQSDADSNQKTSKRKKIERPEFISEESWKSFYDLGRHASDFVLDALAVYESGDFASWDNERAKNIVSSIDKKNEAKKRYQRNLVLEYVLIQRMKEKEFFCCDLCQIILFNYKHALIHFTSADHCKEETDIVTISGVDGFRRVLDLFTDLPNKLSENDETTERDRRKKNGLVDQNLMMKIMNNSETRFRPNCNFQLQWITKYMNLSEVHAGVYIDTKTGKPRLNPQIAAKIVNERVKSEEGRKALAELHEHIAQGQTWCPQCDVKTGNRDGFYAHYLSYVHLKNAFRIFDDICGDFKINLEICTTIVNILKKDLIT